MQKGDSLVFGIPDDVSSVSTETLCTFEAVTDVRLGFGDEQDWFFLRVVRQVLVLEHYQPLPTTRPSSTLRLFEGFRKPATSIVELQTGLQPDRAPRVRKT